MEKNTFLTRERVHAKKQLCGYTETFLFKRSFIVSSTNRFGNSNAFSHLCDFSWSFVYRIMICLKNIDRLKWDYKNWAILGIPPRGRLPQCDYMTMCGSLILNWFYYMGQHWTVRLHDNVRLVNIELILLHWAALKCTPSSVKTFQNMFIIYLKGSTPSRSFTRNNDMN